MENVFQAYSPTAPTHSTALEYQRASGIGWNFLGSYYCTYALKPYPQLHFIMKANFIMPLISSWKFQHKVTYFFNSRPLLPLG
jgi:hypothetical protein